MLGRVAFFFSLASSVDAGTGINNPGVTQVAANSPADYAPQHDGGASDHVGPVARSGAGPSGTPDYYQSYSGRDAKGGQLDYTDASPNPTGASHGGRDPRREPHVTWSGDLDPKSRSLEGVINIRPGMDARALTKWHLFPSGDGTYDGKLPNHFADGAGVASDYTPQYTGQLGVTGCGAYPSGSTDSKTTHGTNGCTNNSPYSPKCTTGNCKDTKTLLAHDGTKTEVSRERITIVPGDSGEYYISRVQNQVCEYGTSYDPTNQGNHGRQFDSSRQAEDGANSVNSGAAGTISGGSVQTGLEDPSIVGLTDWNPAAEESYSGTSSGGMATVGTHNYMSDRTCQGDTSEDHYRNTQTFRQGESMTINLPYEGWLTLVLHDFDGSQDGGTDGLTTLKTDSSCGGSGCDLSTTDQVDKYHDVITGENLLWQASQNPSGKGFTALYQPSYPDVEISGLMANKASGFVVVGVYDYGSGSVEDGENTRYIETRDWMVPNVTCTPTTMHCPIPNVWAHIDYTTPSMYPEPAEGSCEQVRTGSSSLSRCSDKDDTNTRWYAVGSISTTSLPGQSKDDDDTEDNGQAFADDTFGVKHNNWAGNCGDSTSYFWFEKIACGSTRIFHTDGRSLIEDSIVLSPTWEAIRDILAEYYTTKAPLAGADNSDGMKGFTFINADYHVAPVLPPKVECSCLAAMDAYASLLSVQSKTPTPGAPVTLDPEVLNTGSSKIVATLRMYHDPTYSLSAEQDSTMPIVVSRFYLEVSTKFTRNRITISDCTASNREQLLNGSSALKPRSQYCDNTTFDTRTESSPAGVTHMDRISMKKFKFHTTTDVFMQCKIRACAAQPCGTCQRRQLASAPDLSPVEGEMFAPPTKIRVSPFDKNALVFQSQEYVPPPTARAPVSNANIAVQQGVSTDSASAPVTTQPIQVASQVTLPFTTAWANENRAALTSTLRSTLGLTAAEDLVITSISAARRLETRELQASSAKVDFVVGVADNSRAQSASSALSQLASGNSNVVQSFTATLNTNLRNRGKATVQIEPSQIRFVPATTTANAPAAVQQTTNTAAYGMNSFSFSNTGGVQPSTSDDGAVTTTTVVKESSNTSMLIIVVLVVAAAAALYLLASRKSSGAQNQNAGPAETYDNNYASKVAGDMEGVNW